jgi:hypothetical protein
MHKIEVDIVHTKTLQTQVQVLLYPGVICTPQLRCNKDVLSLYSACKGGLETFSNFILIGIAVSCTDQSSSKAIDWELYRSQCVYSQHQEHMQRLSLPLLLVIAKFPDPEQESLRLC